MLLGFHLCYLFMGCDKTIDAPTQSIQVGELSNKTQNQVIETLFSSSNSFDQAMRFAEKDINIDPRTKELALKGDSVHQTRMGVHYELGEGVEQDYQQAFKWYSKAAEQGNSLAILSLANLYKMGLGVDVDFEQAFKLHIKAAELGNTLAQIQVAAHYDKGLGVQKSNIRAYVWLLIAKEKVKAFENLGLAKKLEKQLSETEQEEAKEIVLQMKIENSNL